MWILAWNMANVQESSPQLVKPLISKKGTEQDIPNADPPIMGIMPR